MRKRVVFITGIVLCAAIAITIVYGITSANTDAQNIGEEFSSIVDSHKVIATVGNYSITQLDVDQFKVSQEFAQLYMTSQGGATNPYTNLSDTEIVEKLIESKVLYSEANEHGLIVSDDVVNDYVATLKEQNKIADATLEKLLKDYANGMGMTVDEYFDAAKPTYKEAMSIGQLRTKLLKDITGLDNRIAQWNSIKTSLVEKYQSEINIS